MRRRRRAFASVEVHLGNVDTRNPEQPRRADRVHAEQGRTQIRLRVHRGHAARNIRRRARVHHDHVEKCRIDGIADGTHQLTIEKALTGGANVAHQLIGDHDQRARLSGRASSRLAPGGFTFGSAKFL
jgi:hypothetical protein